MLILEDGSLECKSVTLDPAESVSRALMNVGHDKDIAPHVPHVSKAIRVYDGQVFVDDRDHILWLMGFLPDAPNSQGNVTVVKNGVAS